MEKYSAEQIQQKYDTLPLKVREVFEGAETAETLQQIGKKHKLMLDQLGELTDETGLVILGLTHPKDYINNISARLSVEKETAKNIAEEVNQKVFQKIREELKKIHSIEETTEEAAIPPAIRPKTTPPPKFVETPQPATLPAIITKPEITVTPTPPSALATETKTPTPVIKPIPSPVSPFEQKLKDNEILRSPIKPTIAPSPEKPTPTPTPRYSGNDPYREPTE
ncbi:MAG: hypothetical protein AAB378_03095 [Patescibacteria group bacterium]